MGVNAALARERAALLEQVEPLAHLSNPTEQDSTLLEREKTRDLDTRCIEVLRILVLTNALLPPLSPFRTICSQSPGFFFENAEAATDLVNLYGPDSADLRKVRDFLFDALHRLLLSPHAKFFLWLATQPQDFFAPSRSMDADAPAATLWSLLCAEMYLTPEQGERLHKQLQLVISSPAAAHETWRLGATAACIARLRAAVAATAATAHAQLMAVRGALTTVQFVKAEAWTTRNAARIAQAANEK